MLQITKVWGKNNIFRGTRFFYHNNKTFPGHATKFGEQKDICRDSPWMPLCSNGPATSYYIFEFATPKILLRDNLSKFWTKLLFFICAWNVPRFVVVPHFKTFFVALERSVLLSMKQNVQNRLILGFAALTFLQWYWFRWMVSGRIICTDILPPTPTNWVSTIGVRGEGSGGTAALLSWKFSGQTMFSGQAQVSQKSWMIKNISIRWKIPR